jgi:hypothetical protein
LQILSPSPALRPSSITGVDHDIATRCAGGS